MKMKHICLLFLIATFLLTACGEEEVNRSRAKVTFDETSTTIIEYDEIFVVKGQITIPLDVDLTSINIYCQEYKPERPESHLCASLSERSPEIKRINDKLFEFEITQDNEVARSINGLVGIKVDVKLKTDYATTLTWEIKDAELLKQQVFIWTFDEAAGGPGEGLTDFGLKWVENRDTSSVIQKDSAVKLVALDTTQWNNLSWRRQLKKAIDSNTGIEEYVMIPIKKSKISRHVLGIQTDEDFRILNITTISIAEDEEDEIKTEKIINIIGTFRK